MRLGAWLLSKGKLTEDQLQRALQHQAFFGGRLGSSLIKLGYIDEDVLGAYLSDVSGAPYAPPSLLESIPAEAIAVVPGRLASKYRVVPVAAEGRHLRLAMRDPKDLIALDEIAFLTGLTIEPYVATEFRIQRALQRYYEVTPAARSTVPLAGGTPAAVAPAPARTAPPSQRPPVAVADREVGLDGYPLDADPDQIDSAQTGGRAGAPAHGGEADMAPPTSLQQWRLAQEEIPEDIPEPAPVAPPQAGSAYAMTAASPAPAEITAPAPVQRPIAAMAPPAQPPSPQPAGAPPLSAVDAIATRLRQADARDEIFEALLDYAAASYRRCALFIVQADRILGWSGRGPGIDPERVRRVVVPLDRPSLFAFLRRGADYYHGPVPDLPANTRFYFDLGCPAPARVFLSPLLIKERPTVIVYADNEAESVWMPEVASQRRVLAKAALALEILILKHKIMTL